MSDELSRATQRLQYLLQHPEALGQPGATVELIETHISWVLLVGAHAYKIKKPLALPFLDFSTLALRRRACEEELRINQRTAPDLYLAVLPVIGTDQAPRLGGCRTWGAADDAIDWVVHMRRFPSGTLLTDLLQRDALGPKHVDDLARSIASFQAEAAVAAPDSPWGQPEALLQLARDNFAPIAQALQHDAALCTQLQQLQQWTEAEASRLMPLMQSRRAAGFVREGHGDLHLGNLLWLDGRARLFDAIEFDPQLRWLDTACDIAFLFMDLHAHGQAPLAWRFVNAWLEHSGDTGALLRLHWDAVYRALVRAKVACFRIAPGAGADDPARAEVARYLRLAQQLARPRAPWLALTVGVSGSGKSSQSQALVEQRGLVRLRADVMRKRLFGLAPDASSASVPGGIYSEATSDRLFARMLEQARALLDAGQPVLVDATFIRAARRAPFIKLARQLGLPWRILYFDAPEPVLRERVRQRQAAGLDASEADEAVLGSQLAARDPLDADELAHTLHIDSSQPVDWADWDQALPSR